MNKQLAIGIDLGGTGIKVALIEHNGKILERFHIDTPPCFTPKVIVDQIHAGVEPWLKGPERKHIQGIGIGCAGDIDAENGVVRLSPNLGWKNVHLMEHFNKSFPSLPLVIDNDANVAAWAAYCVEAERKVQTLLCITLGTGIGGGIVINGRLYRGATGSAGEFGHTTLHPAGIPCACGNRGCLERYASGRAIVDETVRLLREGAKSKISDLVKGDLTQVDARVIHRAALDGCEFAKEVWRRAGENLGIAMASLINAFNPERIYLCGGISRAGKLLLEPCQEAIKQRAFPMPAQTAKIVLSRLDQDLGVVGAGLSIFP